MPVRTARKREMTTRVLAGRGSCLCSVTTCTRARTRSQIAASTGELLDTQTVDVGRARVRDDAGLGARAAADQVWALEDCPLVSGAFGRFLLVRGERAWFGSPRG
jgi:hypothetical protein